MNIEGRTALVTGANRGLGRAYVEALLAAGATTVYAGARNPEPSPDPRIVPVRLDVTREEDVRTALERCRDVTLLVNNAGVMLLEPVLGDRGETALRQEFEVNVLGVQRMIRHFAPQIAANGGGAIANMLSVVSLYVFPFNGTYCVSKQAALAVTDGARMELRRRGVHVMGVFAGFIDTDMASDVAAAKVPPAQVATRTLAGLRAGSDYAFGDDYSAHVWDTLRKDPTPITADLQAAWDEGRNAWTR